MRAAALLLILVSVTPGCGLGVSRGDSSLLAAAGPSPSPSPSPAIGGPRLLFHWGSVSANRDLLAKAGYPGADGHEAQWGGDVHGDVNAALIDLTRTWYAVGGGGDIAGPGLYVSNSPTDSESFGPDLLVVERITADGALSELPIWDSFSTRNAAVAAIANHDDSALRLMSRYTDTWNVISRSPIPADGVRFAVRPPRLADVDEIVGYLKTKGAGGNVLRSWFNIIEVSTLQKSPVARMFGDELQKRAGDELLGLDVSALNYSDADFYNEVSSSLSDRSEPYKTLAAKMKVHLLDSLLAATRTLRQSDWFVLSAAIETHTADLDARILHKFSADAAVLPDVWTGGMPTLVAALLPAQTQAKRQEVEDAMLKGLDTAGISYDRCLAKLSNVAVIGDILSSQSTLIKAAARACFVPTPSVSAATFYRQYLDAYQTISRLSDITTDDLAEFISSTTLRLRTSDAPGGATQVLPLVAVLAASQQDLALQAKMIDGLKAALSAAPLKPNELKGVDLDSLRTIESWVRYIGFPGGMPILAKLAPAATGDLVANLTALKSRIPDAIEQDNLASLIATLNAN